MAETKPIPVRLSNETIARLDAAAARAHMSSRTEVMKVCIQSFLDFFEANEYAKLPLDWEAMIKDLDNRTHRYADKIIDLKVAEDTTQQYRTSSDKRQEAQDKGEG